jgi:hypothetical protein
MRHDQDPDRIPALELSFSSKTRRTIPAELEKPPS